MDTFGSKERASISLFHSPGSGLSLPSSRLRQGDDFLPHFSGPSGRPFLQCPQDGQTSKRGLSLPHVVPPGASVPPESQLPGAAVTCGSGGLVSLQVTKASRRRLTVSLAYSESHQIRVSQQDFRLFRTLFLLMVSFFIMWSPIIVTILLILIQNFNQDLVIWPSLFFWVVAFTFANSALNPILYNMSLFRNKWRKIFRGVFFPEKGAMFTDTSLRRNDLSIIST